MFFKMYEIIYWQCSVHFKKLARWKEIFKRACDSQKTIFRPTYTRGKKALEMLKDYNSTNCLVSDRHKWSLQLKSIAQLPIFIRAVISVRQIGISADEIMLRGKETLKEGHWTRFLWRYTGQFCLQENRISSNITSSTIRMTRRKLPVEWSRL